MDFISRPRDRRLSDDESQQAGQGVLGLVQLLYSQIKPQQSFRAY